MAKQKKIAFSARLTFILIGALFVVLIANWVASHYFNSIVIEYAELYNSEGYIQSTGIFVRDERLVTYDGGGIISYVYDDGEKLAKNSVIAKIYSSEGDLALQNKIDDLNDQIRVLRDAEKLIGSDNSQLEAFSNQIYERHSKMLQEVLDGDYASASRMKNEYLNLICKKQIVGGQESGYSDKITELENRIAAYSAQISSHPRDLSLQDVGYFVSSADGYEEKLNSVSMDALTKEDIEDVINNPSLSVGKSVIGKIVADYKWSMVCIVPAEQSKNIYKNAQMKVRVGNNPYDLVGNVESIESLDQDNKKLVLSFNVFNQSLVTGRTAHIKILFDEYSGIRIPSSAIHFNEEGQKGVFIKYGVNVHFSLIDVIRTEGDYTLVRDTTGMEGYLELYDSVIVEGNDLHEGKIVI